MQDLYTEFKAAIRAFHSRGILHAVCGGLAHAIHVEARATDDMDFLICPEELEGAGKVIRGLGYTVHPRRISRQGGKLASWRLWKAEQGDQDILTVDLVLLDEAVRPEVWKRRQQLPWDAKPLWVVSMDGLLLLKRLRGSKQDLADVEKLERAGRLDSGTLPPNVPRREIDTRLLMTSQLRAMCLDLHRAYLRDRETYALARLRPLAYGGEGQPEASAMEIGAGFREAWWAGDYQVIVAIGRRLPDSFFETNSDIHMYFTLAQERLVALSRVLVGERSFGDSAD